MRAQCGYTSSVTVKPFTHKQGQYLAFIHYFSKVNRRPPAEADMQRYFQVSPPSVHQMILTLEANRFIQRTPGQGRSIRLLLAREDLPDLE
jgi:DNA-binding MarR family transcriptional regulator